MLTLWQHEVAQSPEKQYRDLYCPLIATLIDLERMVAFKDDMPT